jgi:predicted CXXCH cytochrome family protein
MRLPATRSWLLAGTALLVAVGVSMASRAPAPAFSHESHARLFPVCEGCHVGVVSGLDQELYPRPADCLQCHDGTRGPEVEWAPPAPRASNVRFSHPEHREILAAEGVGSECATCHATVEPRNRMSVAAARPALCLQCHAHAAETHLAAGAACMTCHVPLTEAASIPGERLAVFPLPESHREPGFLSAHAPGGSSELATCAVCHARESCERCHANADRLPVVAGLGRDPRVAKLVEGALPEYPLPASHAAGSWAWEHAATARSEPTTCANCHTQPGCQSCHGDALAAAAWIIASLPPAVPGRASGAPLSVAVSATHPGGFAERHGTWAASGALDCARCHSPSRCADCHAGTAAPGFHPPNFLERHAVDVFARGSDCQSCHSPETFCQSCHTASGLGSQGRMTAAFHTGQPMWVLSHGQAARAGLESCVACHQQSDCLQCHSASGGWGVNPHGPGFAAQRLSARTARTCQVCHHGDPMGRN